MIAELKRKRREEEESNLVEEKPLPKMAKTIKKDKDEDMNFVEDQRLFGSLLFAYT